MKAKSKRFMGLFLALVMLIGCLPLNTIETYAAEGDVEITVENFPDDNFRTYVKQFDKNNDNILSQIETNDVEKIDVNRKNITSLKGIEYFTKLIYLFCNYNKLTELDVSKNTALGILECFGNKLTKLDVRNNTDLGRLVCGGNDLTELDVSKNTTLNHLDCGANELTKLDVSKNTALQFIFCGANKLTKLDVSNNTALINLDCRSNNLTELDVRNNTDLRVLDCYDNKLAKLDVSNNTVLNTLNCGSNQLKEFDVSKNTALTDLDCHDNQLTALKLPSTQITKKKLNQKYSISVPKGNSIIDFPSGFDASKIAGRAAGLTVADGVVEWDEKTKPITIKYKLCDNPEEIVDITVELTEAPNPELEAATKLVETAEKDRTKPTYDTAKAAVDKLAKGSGKKGLEERLAAIILLDEIVGPKDPTKPDGKNPDTNKYYAVTFKSADEAKGKVAAENTFYILKTANKTLADLKDSAPATTAVGNNKFDGWEPLLDTNTAIDKDLTVKAKFSALEEVVGPKDPTQPGGENPDTNKYYAVTFKSADEAKGTVAAENTFYILKTAGKTLADLKDSAPATTALGNNKFDGWDPALDTNTAIDKDLTVKAKFSALEEVVGPKDPTQPGGENPDTNKYYAVTFKSADEAKGTVAAENTFYILKTAGKTLADIKDSAPATTAVGNNKFDGWEPLLDTNTAIDKDLTVKAKFSAKVFDPDHVEKMVVKTQPTKLNYTEGEKLELAGLEVTLTDNQGLTKNVAFADFATYSITANPTDGTELKLDDDGKPISLTKGSLQDETANLTVNAKVTPQDPPVVGPVDPTDPNGGKPADTSKYYVVTFVSSDTEKGTVAAKNTVYVLKTETKTLADITAPEKTAVQGYEFDKWDPALDANTTIAGDMTVKAYFKQAGTTPTPTPEPIPSYPRYEYNPFWHIYFGSGTAMTNKTVELQKKVVMKLQAKLVIGSKEMIKTVDGVEQKVMMDIAPFIESNRTMLPIRFVAEALGFKVEWEDATRTVILTDKGFTVKIPVDTNKIIVNGNEYESDVKPVLRNNRTMLPIGNIARALGLKDGTDIIWDGATRTVVIKREIEK